MVIEGKGVCAASDLADKTLLPLPTTSKVLKKLTKSGILIAQRGAAGGYKLGREPEHISIASIIEAMDGPISITDCANADNAKACSRTEEVCPMRSNWHKINAVLRAALEEVALASMVPNPKTLGRMEFADQPSARVQ